MHKYPEIYYPNISLNVVSVDVRKFPVFEAKIPDSKRVVQDSGWCRTRREQF